MKNILKPYKLTKKGMGKTYVLSLLIMVFGFLFSTQAQTNVPSVKYFTLDDGLSQVSINALLQDHLGFVWVGTADGLNRFDGQDFMHYKYDQYDSTTISGNNISKLLQDTNGNIWVGTTSNGLNYYDYQYDEFRRIKFNYSINANENISDLVIDEDSVIWASSQVSGLHRLQRTSDGSFLQQNYLNNIPINAMVHQSHDILWAGDLNGDLYKIDLSDSSEPLEKLETAINGSILALHKTSNSLFIGTNLGLYQYDMNTGSSEFINLESVRFPFNSPVTSFLKESTSSIWIGTQKGLYLFDWIENKVIQHITHIEANQSGLSNDAIQSLVKLSEKELLVGTSTYLNLLNFNKPYFKNISKDKLGKQLLNDNVVFSILEDDTDLWVGTSDGGLTLIRNGKTFHFSEGTDESDHISGSRIRAMVKDEINQRLWLATSGGIDMIDLGTFNPEKPKFQIFRRNPDNPNSINGNSIKDIALDKNSNLWGVTYGFGAFRLRISNDGDAEVIRFENIPGEKNSLVNNFVNSVSVDSENTIWFGTRGGLSKLSFLNGDFNRPKFVSNKHNADKSKSLSNNEIFDITIDDQNRIWLGTRQGLNLYLKDGEFRSWKSFKLLVWSVQNDEMGNLWMGTSNGITKFDPQNESFSNYGLEDGIQGKEFNAHSKFRNSDGVIYLGGIEGLTYFHPKDLKGIDSAKPLYFSQLRIADQVIEPNSSRNNLLEMSLPKTNRLEFRHNQFPFYLKFSSIDFRLSKNVQFAYKLLPQDDTWNMLAVPEIQFLNLPAGNHTLLVNGFSRGLEWDQAPLEMDLEILPPWWATWWAYAIYLTIAAALGSYFYRFKLSRKLADAESVRIKEVSELKSSLYTNITHEFRTPLTVILGMTQNLKKNLKNTISVTDENSLSMIERNGENLLEMVNEMLDLAKAESGSMELDLVQTDAIPFVKYLSESFHSLAEAKKINLTVYSEIDALEMDIDVNKMASIISNLLSNAIKFTSANGKIIVHLTKIKTKASEFFSIKVQDNGLGLAEDDIAHLFDRFYQVDNESSQYQEGTGIGLSLAKEFVELMNGTIGVESTLGKGSTFTVQIPVTNNAHKTVDAKIMVEPPIKKIANSSKTEPSVLDELSSLPLALIIEDNEDVAHYLKTCLKGKYQTMHASNGNLGIEMAYEKIPDIIISDVMMPGKDGFEVCATLKAEERTDHIPIVLLTAKVTTEDRLEGLSHGADAYLAKPFNEKELFIRLDQLVLLRKKLIDKIQKDGLNKFLDKQTESPETKFLQKVIQFINEDISNSTFGSSDLADKLHLSESQIYRKLKAITDKSTAVFIRSIRLQKAKELIEITGKTISEIAYETGFNDPSWFSRAFKEEYGFAPRDIHK